MAYRTTESECQKLIGDVVCSRCAGPITPIETVDNARNPTYWAGCKSCCCFDNGYPKRVYDIARTMVVERYFRPYSNEAHPDDSHDMRVYKEQAQISGACSIVSQILYLHSE